MKNRPIREIAAEIRADWKNVNYAAKPYLDAMASLEDAKDYFFNDSAVEIVMYFLSNANSWRGAKAREIKAELKAMFGFK